MDLKKSDLTQRIQNSLQNFSKGQKLIAEFIISQYEKAAFMTAAKLGDIVGVSESTVVRFATELGYDGYPKLQKALQEIVRNKLTSVQRIEVSSSRMDEKNILRDVLVSDMEKIRMTIEEIDEVNFNHVVDCLLKAGRIYVLGVRSSFTLANFFWFYLNFMFDNVTLVSTYSSSQMSEQMFRAGAGDVVVGISFPRYSRSTVKAIQTVKNQGGTIVTITDSILSPLASCADHVIIARSDMASFADSLVAPLSVINALIVAIGMKMKGDIYNTFNKLESIWDEYEVYETYNSNKKDDE